MARLTLPPPPAGRRRRRRGGRRVRQARAACSAAPPGRPSSTPEPYSPPVPAPSNYDAPGPPANTVHARARAGSRRGARAGAQRPGRGAGAPGRRHCGRDRRHRGRRSGVPGRQRHVAPAGAPAGGVDTPAEGDPPTQLARDTEAPSTRRDRRGGRAAAPDRRGRHPGPARADRRGGRGAGRRRRGRRDRRLRGQRVRGERVRRAGFSEAERPLAEAGEGVAEGQEQAEAELEENAGPGDEGVSDAERQIEDAIEAADNPAVGETPEPVAPGSERLLGRRRRHLRRRLEDLVGRRGQAAVSGRRLGRSPNKRRNPHVGLKGCALRSDGVGASPRTRPPKEQVPACPAPSVSSCCWQAPAPPPP